MVTFIHTDSKSKDFVSLVKCLDKELAFRDGDDHEFYHQFNSINDIKYAIVAYNNSTPIACGAIKEFDSRSMEVKRMYSLPEYRGKGLASKILKSLEDWARELGYQYCVLETGKKQPEAISLYRKSGYQVTDNYGQYQGIVNSVCFKKKLA